MEENAQQAAKAKKSAVKSKCKEFELNRRMWCDRRDRDKQETIYKSIIQFPSGPLTITVRPPGLYAFPVIRHASYINSCRLLYYPLRRMQEGLQTTLCVVCVIDN